MQLRQLSTLPMGVGVMAFVLLGMGGPAHAGDDCDAREAYEDYLEELRDDPCDDDVPKAWRKYQKELAKCRCYQCRPVHHVGYTQPGHRSHRAPRYSNCGAPRQSTYCPPVRSYSRGSACPPGAACPPVRSFDTYDQRSRRDFREPQPPMPPPQGPRPSPRGRRDI